ncbi:MAG: hypothetical protein HC942_30810 [Microcoleus sp. SU_5_6]|nr:hypothetical protein [Microcoleus sp. SU_5_6]
MIFRKHKFSDFVPGSTWVRSRSLPLLAQITVYHSCNCYTNLKFMPAQISNLKFHLKSKIARFAGNLKAS